ncbi:MAG TPA: hypothetical protein VJ978_06865 [Nitriliruptoraceae bacterium]|nr:hypothetical protein [Nitriliruptoraceae bacterium]
MAIVRGIGSGLVAGAGWGIVARLWMRLVTAVPEFTWTGTLFIVGASALIGAMAGLAIVAGDRAWRGAGVLRGVAVASTILLGVGAGTFVVPTIVFGGVALGVRGLEELALHWRVVTALPIVAIVALLGAAPDSGPAAMAAGATALLLASLVVAGWHLRTVLAIVAGLPAAAAMWVVVTTDIPLWRGLVGAALYVPLVACPVLIVAVVLRRRDGRGDEGRPQRRRSMNTPSPTGRITPSTRSSAVAWSL